MIKRTHVTILTPWCEHCTRRRVHVIEGREGVTDPYGEWAGLREVESTGCVLVRPDRHVAWRSMRHTTDSARQLPAVIEQALGLHPAR